MFTELMPLLRKRRLLLTISLVEGDTIRATVVPQKASDTEDNALTTPLAITGTAEELDRDLPQQLVEFTGAHLQLQTTLASAKAEMDAAAKAAREEARQPAQAGQTKSVLRFGRGSPGKPWHRHDFPALRGPARVLLSPAACGRQQSIIPLCTRSCVSRPALRPPSFASLSSCAIWS